jgi:hypothetical protein
VLLQLPAVQEELKITEAQKKEEAEIEERRSQKIQHARAEIKDRAKFRAARDAIFNETAAARLANLKPDQRNLWTSSSSSSSSSSRHRGRSPSVFPDAI